MVRSTRHIFHIAGYDAIQPSQQYRRFLRELGIFQEAWNVEAAVSDLSEACSYPTWSVRAQGSNWVTNTSYELLAWDDIVSKDARGSQTTRLLKAAIAYFDLIITGTLFRYALASPRYFIFALFPPVQVGLLAFLSWHATAWAAERIGLHDTAALAFVTFGGLALLLVLLRWPGQRLKIQHALDDWIFAHDYIYGRKPQLETRLQHFADRLGQRIRRGGIDEVVIVGHSLGALCAIEIAARALDADPDLGRRGIAVCILTVGATIPKCALHPAAGHLRKRILRVAHEPSIYWAEYQARADAISFYRFDPVKLHRITGKSDCLDQLPVIRRVQIQDMLQQETFSKYRFHVLRLHYQFVMANNRRSSYDYFMMVCGPVPFRQWTTSPGGLLDFFASDEGAKVVSQRIRKPA